MKIGKQFNVHQRTYAMHLLQNEHLKMRRVCRIVGCTRQTLFRWKKVYDGTTQSLQPLSRAPKRPRNAHTLRETRLIKQVIKHNPRLSYLEMWGIVRSQYGYNRTYWGFYRYAWRHNLIPHKSVERYHPKPYHTPTMFGVKWQIDVKYVPRKCYHGAMIFYDSDKFYQYTAIDETTRERFIYAYKEHNVTNTLDFVKRAIAYFGYVPMIIQTDNGSEFTNIRKAGQREPVKHALDKMLEKMHVFHKLIRPATPRHNGKVERSHRTDQATFYDHLKFATITDLREQMAQWNTRYNNRPHTALCDKDGHRVMFTPLQKRAELLQLLQEQPDNFEPVRFIRKASTA